MLHEPEQGTFESPDDSVISVISRRAVLSHTETAGHTRLLSV